jgi:hypothetical protein
VAAWHRAGPRHSGYAVPEDTTGHHRLQLGKQPAQAVANEDHVLRFGIKSVYLGQALAKPDRSRRFEIENGRDRGSDTGARQKIFPGKAYILKSLDCEPLGASRPLLAEMRQSVAQRSAGDLHQSLERRVHFQDQEDRTGNR